MSLANKYSFVPVVAQTNNEYHPNTDSINPLIDGDGVLQGSFHPELVGTGEQKLNMI